MFSSFSPIRIRLLIFDIDQIWESYKCFCSLWKHPLRPAFLFHLTQLNPGYSYDHNAILASFNCCLHVPKLPFHHQPSVSNMKPMFKNGGVVSSVPCCCLLNSLKSSVYTPCPDVLPLTLL
jgi:hypothetical protein